MRSVHALPLLALLGLSPLAFACGDGGKAEACEELAQLDAAQAAKAKEGPALEPGGIHGFASEAELQGYVDVLVRDDARRTELSSRCHAGDDATSSMADMAGSATAAPAAAEGAPANETITNNQEAGVDEGGIVKNVGGSLVVLRKGRLFAVDVGGDGRAPALTDSIRVARVESLNEQVWYDEMIVKGDLVYVVGFRYGVSVPGESVRGATEVDSFRLADGKLVRLKSMFLESNDYYSGNNYASRLVGGKLAFYMPHHLGGGQGRAKDGTLAYPRVLEGRDDGTFVVVGPVFGALDVSTSLAKPSSPTFHTVIQCELPDDGSLGCHGRAVLGEGWREHYVSPEAVYLWSGSHAYRFDLDSLDVTAHATKGSPVDQLSFREGAGALHVAVNDGGAPALLSLPLAAFDKVGGQTVPARALGAGAALTANRFVGDVLVAALKSTTPAAGADPYGYGYGYGYGSGPADVVTLNAVTGASATRHVPGGVVRIEPLGEGRALVASGEGAGGGDLALEALALDDLRLLGRVLLPGVREGEGRTHGFFYKPGEGGAGRFGYAVVSPSGGASRGFGNGVSNLGFFDVSGAGSLAPLGVVSSGGTASQCETSCIDWYGNTRPIFLGSRLFALMGSELSEVALTGGVATKTSTTALTFDGAR